MLVVEPALVVPSAAIMIGPAMAVPLPRVVIGVSALWAAILLARRIGRAPWTGRMEALPVGIAVVAIRTILGTLPIAVVEPAQSWRKARRWTPRAAVMRAGIPASAAVVVVHAAQIEQGLRHTERHIAAELRQPDHGGRCRHIHGRGSVNRLRCHIHRLRWRRGRRAYGELHADGRAFGVRGQGPCAGAEQEGRDNEMGFHGMFNGVGVARLTVGQTMSARPA